MRTVKQLAIRGAIWTLIGFGGTYLLRFGNNLVLTRLLQPEFFGLMAFVNTLRMGLELFSDIGIGQNIVNSKRGDEESFLNTAWTLQVIRGFFIWFICLLISFPLAHFYGDQRLQWLIPIVFLYSILSGFSSTSIHTLQRRMELGKLSLYEVILQFAYFSTLIFLVWLYPSIWTLAFGTLIQGVYKLISSYWLIPKYSNRFKWDRNAVKEILSFGKWMFLASGFMFAAEQADYIILGKLLSFRMLGVYIIAYTLASIPRETIKVLSNKVIFPAIAKQSDLPRHILREKIIPQRRILLIGFAFLLAFLVNTGDLAVSFLYDDRYIDAGWMMPILCCGMWFSLLFYTISPALLALGKPLYSAQSNFARFVIIAIAVPFLFQKFGVVGAVIAIALSDLPLYITNLYGLWREKLLCFTQDMASTVFFMGVLISFFVIRNNLGFGFSIQQLLAN
ncbi:MAG: oligosaccharide flippase family protein [Calothrix sp. MO_167.B42]|nr:oligosaccharide flippase family protein [Calothrix sp. MO_167.B42]